MPEPTGNLPLPRVALGTAPLGGWPTATDPAVAHEVIEAAWESGIRFFDTAPLYGHGLSETWLGEVLSTRPREAYSLSTKVGRLLRPVPATEPSLFHGTPPVNPVFDFSYDGTLRSLSESLERLQLDRVDLVHIHDPEDHFAEAMSGAYRALRRLRDEGVVRAIGAGMNFADVLARFAQEGDFDCFLLAGRYTLLEQGALDELFPRCAERGISVLAGGVFNSGVLADPDHAAYYNYDAAPQPVIQRALEIRAVCDRYQVPLRAAALQFPLAHPVVKTVVMGVRSAAELKDNLEAVAVPIPDDFWQELKAAGLLRQDAPTPVRGEGN